MCWSKFLLDTALVASTILLIGLVIPRDKKEEINSAAIIARQVMTNPESIIIFRNLSTSSAFKMSFDI